MAHGKPDPLHSLPFDLDVDEARDQTGGDADAAPERGAVEGGFVVRHRGWVREEIIDDNIFTERKNDIFKSQTIFWYS